VTRLDEAEPDLIDSCQKSDIRGLNYTCTDHINIDGGSNWLIGSYFMDKLQGLANFSGFFPRLYVPGTNMVSDKNPTGVNSHQALALIDTKLEIEVGVGYDWPPVILGADEI